MGLRSFFVRVLPGRQEIRENKHLQVLGEILHDPNIFHITRRSAAGGVAVGLFFACLPIPGQMLVAAVFAIYFRVNLPLAVVLVWLTNPVTIPPYLFIAYKTGALVLGEPVINVHFELTVEWAREILLDIWQPLLLGCLIYGISSAVAGYLFLRWLWRFTAIRKWEERRLKKLGVRREE